MTLCWRDDMVQLMSQHTTQSSQPATETVSQSPSHWPEVAGAALGVAVALGAMAWAAYNVVNGIPHIHVELPYGNPDNGSISQPIVQMIGSALHSIR